MNLFLVLLFLFFAGSLIGWSIEVVWRRFFSKNNPAHKWINPGFLSGPYLPLYGISLCLLFVLSMIDVSFVKTEWVQKLVLFVIMSLAITVVEFFAGLIFIKGMNIKLWDYSKNRGNIMGIVCPQYTFYWLILSALYYFLVHPKILEWLYWFTNHLTFCLVIGFFYGVLFVDLCYTFNISARIRAYAKEMRVEVRYENLKLQIMRKQTEQKEKSSFVFPFRNVKGSLKEIISSLVEEHSLRGKNHP